jgi:phenylpropionate dioxygenase-like ring-hydroxylating dioxygenase large terminal subunit
MLAIFILTLLLPSIITFPLHKSKERITQVNSHNWYVIGEKCNFEENKPNKIFVKGNPITVWRDSDDHFAGISDICPHRGASLAKGRIDPETNCVVCPYHTFHFNKKGRLSCTPGREHIRTGTNFNIKTDVPHYKISCINNWVYLYNKPLYDFGSIEAPSSSSIWLEPEARDKKFKPVMLSKEFNIDARTVTENSLDILHISEVHSFGNPESPLPLKTDAIKINDGHYKMTYEYLSGKESVAKKAFGIDKLIVENEYILPHHTIARVIFGDYTNTIITSALPISENKTRLFVKAYRDNWINTGFDYIFDLLTLYWMEKTLSEDKNVIESIYPKYRDGNFITKYDNLVKQYREDYNSFLQREV